MTEALKAGILKPTTSQTTMTSTILTQLSKTYPQVLTNPESVLGSNAPKVLDFWRHIETLSEQEREEIIERYQDLGDIVRDSAWFAANNAAEEVIGREFSDAAWKAAYDVTGWWVFGYATLELIGDVKNKVFYDLIMSHKQP